MTDEGLTTTELTELHLQRVVGCCRPHAAAVAVSTPGGVKWVSSAGATHQPCSRTASVLSQWRVLREKATAGVKTNKR